MTLNYFIWLFLKPSHLILIAALIGLLRRKTAFGRACQLFVCSMIVLFGLLPAADLLIRPLETRFPIPQLDKAPDGVIVLGGSELVQLSRAHNQPQLSSRGDRLTTFLLLAEKYPDARLVHSGGIESDVARDLLIGSGIDGSRMRFEADSRNTCDSAQRLFDVLAPRADQRWLLVTSGFHMPRSVACFRTAGWSVIPFPADLRASTTPIHVDLVSNFENLDLAVHEWLGLLYYRALGRTNVLYPKPQADHQQPG